jgi:hypothetical protein
LMLKGNNKHSTELNCGKACYEWDSRP